MNDYQMQLVEDKYGKLIHKIGHNISGDIATCSHEDNTQDIWIAAMEAIRGYEKKEKIPFEEFWGTKGFDKYIKTCLWNLKNAKGAKVSKKYEITRDVVSVSENEEVLLLEDHDSCPNEHTRFYEEISDRMSPDLVSVVKELVENPDCIKSTGKVNVRGLSTALGKTWHETNILIKELERKMENQL